MRGMHPVTGRTLSGLAHLHYAMSRILMTPLGSRVMRRDFGSALSNLLDAPLNATLTIPLYAAVAEALSRWEPRLNLSEVHLSPSIEGTAGAMLTITGTVVYTDAPVHLDIPLSQENGL